MYAAVVSKILIVFCMVHNIECQVSGFVPCEPVQPYDGRPPLPTLPDQYETSVEANIVQKNYTTMTREFYDYPNNRFTTEWSYRRDGSRVRMVARPEQSETFTIFENKTCHVRHINTTGGGFYWFVSGQNGTHVKSVKDLLQFGAEFGEKYIGESVVRGIPVQQWQSCMKYTRGQGNFTLDYYFTKNDSYMVDGKHVQIPVRAVLQGQGENWRNKSAGIHSYYHYYDFFDFHAGPPRYPEVFEIPPGVFCNGSNITKPLPLVKAQFTAGVEEVVEYNEHHNERPVTLYMDQSSSIVRIDSSHPFTKEDVTKFGDKPLTYISDEKTGLLYVMDQWERNCTVIGSAEDVPLFMTPAQFLAIFQKKYVYQGKKIFRGFNVESWSYFNKTKQIITELLFHESHMFEDEDIYMDNSPDPPSSNNGPHPDDDHGDKDLRLVGMLINSLQTDSQDRSQMTIHFYGLNPRHPAPEVFDISSCYSLGYHYVYMALQIEGNYMRDVLYRKGEFIIALRSALARGAGVSVTRINSILVEQSRGDDNRIVAYFKMLDNQIYGVPDHSLKGPTLSQAKLNLQDAIAKGLNFDVQYPTIENNFEIVKDTLWETLSSMSMRTDKPSTLQRYSAGAMAGLGIGMLVVGGMLGLLVAFVIYKRIDTTVPYQVTR